MPSNLHSSPKVTSIGSRGFPLALHVILVTQVVEAKFQCQVWIFGARDVDFHIIDFISCQIDIES